MRVGPNLLVSNSFVIFFISNIKCWETKWRTKVICIYPCQNKMHINISAYVSAQELHICMPLFIENHWYRNCSLQRSKTIQSKQEFDGEDVPLVFYTCTDHHCKSSPAKNNPPPKISLDQGDHQSNLQWIYSMSSMINKIISLSLPMRLSWLLSCCSWLVFQCCLFVTASQYSQSIQLLSIFK